MIKDIDTFRQLIPTVTGGTLDKYLQPIADAQEWLVSKIAGPKLMDEILRAGESDPPAELFTLARRVVAYKAYIDAIPKMDVLETANGFAVVNDEKLVPASRERVNALIVSMSDSLMSALEALIEYLEDTPQYAEAWKSSPSYSIISDSLLPSLRLFRRYGRFDGNYLDFITSRPAMLAIQMKFIEPKVSRELLAEIISQIREDSLTDANRAILDDLRFALAGFYNSDPELGDASLCRVREVLEQSPSDYPAFEGSRLYRLIREAESREKSDNRSIFVMI